MKSRSTQRELIVPWAGIKFSTSGADIGQNELGTGMIGQYQKGKDGKMTLEIVYPFESGHRGHDLPHQGMVGWLRDAHQGMRI